MNNTTRFLLSLLSAAMLSVGWLGISGVPLLAAFVPLLLISSGYDKSARSFWKMFLWILLSFGLWHMATVWWVVISTPIGLIAPFIVTIGLFGGVFMLYHYVSKRARSPLAFTLLVSAWIAAEYLYTVGEVSFPWLTLGNGFANDIKLVQWYDTTGIFGGSLWVWVCNLLIFSLLRHRTLKYKIVTLVFILVPPAISLPKYFTYRETGRTLVVTSVQPNLDPYREKFVLSQDLQTQLLLDLAAKAPANADYIIMPETAIDDRLWENDIDNNATVGRFRELAREKYPDTQFIVGASTYRRYSAGEEVPYTARTRENLDFWYDTYNSAIAIDRRDETEIHHKSMLVVGVEKMPYKWLMDKLEYVIVDLGGISGQLGIDTVRKVFVHPNGTMSGPAICYESIYGEYYGEFVKNGAQVMFIITNDGWWGNTWGHRQHFSYARLRAVESRRSIGRSANTGISGFINQRGDVLSQSDYDERITMTGEITTNDHITFYTKYGDYIARLSVYVMILSVLYYMAYRIKRRQHLVE